MIKINNEKLEIGVFPGGESNVKVPYFEGTCVEIESIIFSSKDIVDLLMVVDAIRRINIHAEIYLTIPYFPYARQDRVCNDGEALGVKVMADLINNLNCNKVTIFDPHSDVTPALLNNCEVITQYNIIDDSMLVDRIINRLVNGISFVSPDSGAEKKVMKVCSRFSNSEIIKASKTRDTLTGDITGTVVNGDVEGKNLLILDDICDGGRTFIELAKVLKEKGSNKLFLYVTHGIFSRGLSELSKYFEEIYCYNLMNSLIANEKKLINLRNQ